MVAENQQMMPGMRENHHIATRRSCLLRTTAFAACLVLLVIFPAAAVRGQNQANYTRDTLASFDQTIYSSGTLSLPPSSEIRVPAAFTPDGDGINDVFSIDAEGITTCNMVIYDRWGNVVFHSSSVDRGWNGMVGSHHAPTGIYFYELRVYSSVLGQMRKAGTVTLALKY